MTRWGYVCDRLICFAGCIAGIGRDFKGKNFAAGRKPDSCFSKFQRGFDVRGFAVLALSPETDLL